MITNYDHCLRFQVSDKRISCLDDAAPAVVADNRGCVCVRIEFDEQWDGVGKVARFIYSGKFTDVVLDKDGECICPAEVLKKGRFLMGVYGADLKSTTPIAVTVDASILSESGEELPAEPTSDVYTQILQQYKVTCEEADEAAKAAWASVERSIEAIESINKAKEELENDGFITGVKECNNGNVLSFWVGTHEEYDALLKINPMCLYIITNKRLESIENMEEAFRLIHECTTTTQANTDTLQTHGDNIRYLTEEVESLRHRLDNLKLSDIPDV